MKIFIFGENIWHIVQAVEKMVDNLDGKHEVDSVRGVPKRIPEADLIIYLHDGDSRLIPEVFDAYEGTKLLYSSEANPIKDIEQMVGLIEIYRNDE